MGSQPPPRSTPGIAWKIRELIKTKRAMGVRNVNGELSECTVECGPLSSGLGKTVCPLHSKKGPDTLSGLSLFLVARINQVNKEFRDLQDA